MLRAFSWKQKQAQTTRSNRDFSSREPTRPDAEVIANGRQSEQGEDQVEEEGKRSSKHVNIGQI
jgi:hypothetical protein